MDHSQHQATVDTLFFNVFFFFHSDTATTKFLNFIMFALPSISSHSNGAPGVQDEHFAHHISVHLLKPWNHFVKTGYILSEIVNNQISGQVH